MTIYETPEWKGIDPLERAQLLLVMESQRPASYTIALRGSLIDILKERGLEAQPVFHLTIPLKDRHLMLMDPRLVSYLTDPPKDRHLMLLDQWLVSLPESLRNHNREIVTAKDMDAYHRELGTFLGYPNCCVEAFIREHGLRTEPLHGREKKMSNYQIEVARERELGHDIPAGLDYLLFVPCSISCSNAINTGMRWGQTLRENDEEAAHALLLENYLNRGDHLYFQEVSEI